MAVNSEEATWESSPRLTTCYRQSVRSTCGVFFFETRSRREAGPSIKFTCLEVLQVRGDEVFEMMS